MKRTGFAKADCPVARALDAIGDWWSLLIVRDAFDGLRRFGDFQKNLGIAKGMLTARLRTLVELGVLEQVAASDGSAYQEYVLTKRGHDLFPIVVSLRQWGEAHLYARGEPHSVLLDPAGQAVGQLVLPSKGGKPLVWSDTKVKKVAVRKR
ncbi:helix-turn-helix transcriptional regulator [Bradyrhizobium tropiciagri]|uniref:winged helix-turn-helix transcriptional regulator n=1 Tax=Bradyrhizobium tropiciagri TaxID=312253 RepID=UPI001BA511B7|nr:helix-turn-helix domain-containing protein [Bradyrhizobium tropiciagri]MBR0895690.1 helix-turn-helix transcriptional regulator [Bradyrhizobium tropiciagri]